MLVIVSPNLAIDRIIELEQLRVGEVQRSSNIITQPGGKGCNVARVFRQLGGEVTLVGFAGRRNSAWIREPLKSIGIQLEVHDGHGGETRVCTIILEKNSGRHPTVINEESAPILPEALDLLVGRLDALLAHARAVLVTGSLPPGIPVDFYGQVIRKTAGKSIFTAIDATGDVLRSGLAARPSLVKVNLEEMSSVLGPLGSDATSITQTIRQHSDRLPPHTIVTMGESGAILVTGSNAWHAQPPRVSHVNPIGSGDSFAAGYLKAILDGSSEDGALRFAAAVAASDAATPAPGNII